MKMVIARVPLRELGHVDRSESETVDVYFSKAEAIDKGYEIIDEDPTLPNITDLKKRKPTPCD